MGTRFAELPKYSNWLLQYNFDMIFSAALHFPAMITSVSSAQIAVCSVPFIWMNLRKVCIMYDLCRCTVKS